MKTRHAVLLIPIFSILSAHAADPVDLVLRGGKIVTVDKQQPAAQALAVTKGRIVAVGTDQQIKPLVGPKTQTIDLAGKLAIPGFIEGHGHFTGVGEARLVL